MGEREALAAAPAATVHQFDFRGLGGEFFRIWIVNIVLTVLTVGIYSAWAKVRTTRYLYGNIYLADHAFDYHASPVRLLIGRMIATGLFLGYSISAAISPYLIIPWAVLFLIALPWLAVSSLRFAARNTSYRNVRFNFSGTLWRATKAYILWPAAGLLSFGALFPLARRARDYFYVNNYTYGGKAFHTEFSGWSIYSVFLLGIAYTFAGVAIIGAFVFLGFSLMGGLGPLLSGGFKSGQYHMYPEQILLLILPAYIGFIVMMTAIPQMITTMILNLVVSNTTLDGRHKLKSDVPPFGMAMVMVGNMFLLFFTLGLYYPWARMRALEYQLIHMHVVADGNLDEFTSDVIATQSAVGEEIAGFFDLGIGL